MNAEHVDDLLDLEALGALDGVESSLVRAHVATCPRCQVRLDDAEETAARLALSVPLVRAPAGIKMRLMESVHAADVPVEAPRPVRRVPTAIMRFNRRWGAVAAAVFLIPLAGLLSWNYVLQHQVNELKQENKQIQVAQRDQVVFALPSSLRAQLIPTEKAGDARGTVNWNPDEGKCMVRVRGLAKLDA